MKPDRMTGRVVLLLALAALAGCNSAKRDAARQRQSSHLRTLVSVYNFAASKQGHPPAGETEFKSFIDTSAKPMIDSLKLSSPNELFVSERDGQPFVVVYSKRPPGMNPDVIAYEKTGVDGKRLVGYSLGMIEEVDEARFNQLVPAASNPEK
jgi:hypothetical protein